MKTAEADILEVEDPAKKVRSQKAFEALNLFWVYSPLLAA